MSNETSRGASGAAGSTRNSAKRARYKRNRGRQRTKVCGNKNLSDPRNISYERSGDARLVLSVQHEIDVALDGYPNSDQAIAIQGGTPEAPLLVRHQTRVPPVILDGSYVIAEGHARVCVYGSGSSIVALGNARVWCHGGNHVALFDNAKAEVCNTSTVYAHDNARVAMFHEAAGEMHGHVRCKCKQQTSVDAYDACTVRLMGDSLGVRRSPHASIIGIKDDPYFDELGQTPQVTLNRFLRPGEEEAAEA